jgi:hypothetical protein
MLNTLLKDPQESRLFTMDWTRVLTAEGRTITSSTWRIEGSGLTEVASGIVSGNLKTSVQLSGGVVGRRYHVVNTIVDSDGYTWERTGRLLVTHL